MPAQVDKNMNKAMDSVAKKEKKRREQQKKRKQAAKKFGDIEMDFEIQNTFTEPMKKAKNRKEGKKIVVRLIAYNQEAFADFANISDQSDVESFNQKYNVELVLPVGNQ